MMVTTRTVTYYKVEMTAQQRQALILGLLHFTDNEKGIWPENPLNKEQTKAMDDLRVSLLNAA